MEVLLQDKQDFFSTIFFPAQRQSKQSKKGNRQTRDMARTARYFDAAVTVHHGRRGDKRGALTSMRGFNSMDVFVFAAVTFVMTYNSAGFLGWSWKFSTLFVLSFLAHSCYFQGHIIRQYNDILYCKRYDSIFDTIRHYPGI